MHDHASRAARTVSSRQSLLDDVNQTTQTADMLSVQATSSVANLVSLDGLLCIHAFHSKCMLDRLSRVHTKQPTGASQHPCMYQ